MAKTKNPGRATTNGYGTTTHPTAMGAYHGHPCRDGDGTPTGAVFQAGKFGRMFTLPPFAPPAAALEALGQAMVDGPSHPGVGGDSSAVPAGFTYLGQFIDHDITFDPTAISETAVDPLAQSNFRTPKLDLDSVYAGGPSVTPYLYQRADPAKLVIGETDDVAGDGDATVPVSRPHDLPRSPEGFAIIGDPRNDENLVVSQTHLAFLRFHNAVVDHVRSSGFTGDVFEEARRLVRWHYQWIVLHDFLGRLVQPDVLDDVLANGRQHYRPEDTSAFKEPYIPVEFSVAAYRFGHSMVREAYSYNRVFRFGGVVPATLDLLFQFSGLSGPGLRPPTGGFGVPVPSDWIIDWREFYDIDPAVTPNPTRRIDPFLTEKLHDLPGTPPGVSPSLAVRNLLRGNKMQLPSGQAVAAALGVPVLTPAQIATGPDGAVAAANGLDVQTPLWYYLLKEAEVVELGARMGPAGSRILAEVFVGMVDLDPTSYRAQNPSWTPELPSAAAGDFTMVDLINLMGAVSPLDGLGAL